MSAVDELLCPRCGSGLAENIYGDVEFNAVKPSGVQQVRFRSCVVEEGAVRYECLSAECGHAFGHV